MSKHQALPGRAKPVFGAKYPPLNPATLPTPSTNANDNKTDKSTRNARAFEQFKADTQDLWSAADDELVSATATQVIAQHSGSDSSAVAASPPVALADDPQGRTALQRSHIRQQAMQRLAQQCAETKHRASTHAPPTTTAEATSSLYPRLPRVNAPTSASAAASHGGHRRNSGLSASAKKVGEYRQRRVDDVSQSTNAPTGNVACAPGDTDERLTHMLDEPDTVDVEKMRRLCWKGVPARLRPQIWRIISGYVPVNGARRQATLEKKRQEYEHYVEQYFCARYDAVHEKTFRQIHIDIPRMCPLIPLFQQKLVQEIFERILFIWALRHPATSYVQGINDLVTPYFVVYLSEHIDDASAVSTYDVSRLPSTVVQHIEADTFWCFSRVMDSIQDNYTFSMPGVQTKVHRLSALMAKIDAPLHAHLRKHEVEYLQFSFRWMNNLLMREIPLRATVRLWDTYMSETNGFSDFHVYVCAAFLRMWSAPLQQLNDFQAIMMYLQNPPTSQWGDQHMSELCADAFALKSVFQGAQNHFA